MLKYKATQIIDKALKLADLDNSEYISFGEHLQYLNDAYTLVYNDLINHAVDSYIVSVALNGNGTYDLPNDFYRLRSVVNVNGGAIPRKQLNDSPHTFGYTLFNNKIRLDGIGTYAVLTYYPTPDTITFKPKEVEYGTFEADPISGFGNNVFLSNGAIIDVTTSEYIKEAEEDKNYTNVTLGKYSYLYENKTYDFDGNVLMAYNSPILFEDGTFGNNNYEGQVGVGTSNIDKSVVFYYKSDGIYCNGNKIYETNDTTNPLRYLYLGNKNAVIVGTSILYEDGTLETIDIRGETILLKTDFNSGYGFLVKKGNKYYIDGFLPETLIDYPNNVFFTYVAYQLALTYRNKQSAPIDNLLSAIDKIAEEYYGTLQTDDYSFPRIQNKDFLGSRII